MSVLPTPFRGCSETTGDVTDTCKGSTEVDISAAREAVDFRHASHDVRFHEKPPNGRGRTGYFVPTLGVALAGSSQVTLQFGSAFCRAATTAGETFVFATFNAIKLLQS